MGKNLLLGVGDRARHVKALYVGIGGKARKVKKVYVGVGGKARLVYQSYVAVSGISFTSEKNYNYSGNVSDCGWYAKITISFTPSNATNKAVTWSIAKNGENGNSMYIEETTSNSCVVSRDMWYGGKCILLAKTADGIQKFIYCKCGSSNSASNTWTIYEVASAYIFPDDY